MISDALKVLALTGVWMVMSRHLDWLSILSGAVMSLIALKICARGPKILFCPAFGSFGRLLLFLPLRIVSGSLDVARAVLHPDCKGKISPAIMAVPLESSHEPPAAMLGNALSLTPGSVCVHADLRLQRLYVHDIFAKDPGAKADEARREFGKPLANLLKEEE